MITTYAYSDKCKWEWEFCNPDDYNVIDITEKTAISAFVSIITNAEIADSCKELRLQTHNKLLDSLSIW